MGDITVESTWFPRGAVFLIPNNQPGCLEPSVGCGPYGGFQSIRVPPLIMHFDRILIGFSIINHSFTHFGVTEPPSCRDPSHLSGAKADMSCGMLWAASVGTASSNASRSSFELPGERQICGRPMFPHPLSPSIFMGKPW